MIRLSAASVVLISAMGILLPHENEAGAQITVKFVYYSNPSGLDATGKPCDTFGACDPLFTITTSMPDGSSTQVVTQRVSDRNSISFGDKIVNVNNPLVYSQETYKGRFTIQVKVDDYDPVGEYDYMGTFSFTYLGSAVPNAGIPSVSEVQLNDDGSSGARLVLQIWVVCNAHYYGSDCAKRCVPADDDTQGHYTCDSAGNKLCLSTYDPWSDCLRTFCANRVACANGARCANLDASFVCSCVGLWGGPTCSAPVSACELSGSPCRNNGTCVSGTGGSGCRCPPNYAGTTCSDDVNECLPARPPVCQHATACDNQPGTYSCRCQPGWQGRNCSQDIDECAPTAGSPCYNGGACVNRPGSFACACPSGFQGDRCQLDVDECADNATRGGARCRESVEVCQNLRGGFVCLCRAGWAGLNCSVQYLTQEQAQAVMEGRLLAGVLVPTLLLLALGLAAGLVGYFCLYRRRVVKQRQAPGSRGSPQVPGEPSTTFTENASYAFSRARESGEYEDADAQYTKIRAPTGGECDGGYESAGGRELGTSGAQAIAPPPLPPKRTFVELPPLQQQRSQDSANYSLMSEAVSSCGQLDQYAISQGYSGSASIARARRGTDV